MDDRVTRVSRKTYKIADAFGDVGGFMSVILIIGFIIVRLFQEFIYKSMVLNAVYVE
jgi:hypothetical protein